MNTTKKQNILLIITDQQFAGAMSAYNHPEIVDHINTPNMDRIAQMGTLFKNAYSVNPICVPARTSMFTGRMPHKTGVDQNENMNFPMKGECIGKYIKEAGYDTGYVGKWHVPHDLDNVDWSGFDFRDAVDLAYQDPAIPEACDKFLNIKRDKPFFLVASFVNPHDICEHARRASGMTGACAEYKNASIGECTEEQWPPLRRNNVHSSTLPSAISEHQFYDTQKNTYPTRDWPEGDPRWKEYLWTYYRMVEGVDKYIGDLLDSLEKTGAMDNTLILFTSDHGDGMGAHGWNQKSLFYEEVAQIPFIICRPDGKHRGLVDDKTLVNGSIDIAPTLLALADVKTPQSMTGNNLLAVQDGKDEPQEFVISTTHLHKAYGVRGNASGRMLRSKNFKYIVFDYGENPEQLFAMDGDRLEMEDLAHDPSYRDTLFTHRELLRKWLHDNEDGFQIPFP